MTRLKSWLLLSSVVVLLGAVELATPRPSRGGQNTGQITGKISFTGERPKLAPIQMDQDPVCAALHTGPANAPNNGPGEAPVPSVSEDGAVNSDGTLPNAFLYVKSGLQQSSYPPPNTPVVLDQRGCVYVPHVLGIIVGQELRVLSSDPTTHNVHVLAKDNKQWNQSQIPGAAPIVKKFTKPEIMVPVKCNQHPWMKAYIGVVTNPFYAVTGKDGTFTIKGLPPGSYTLGAWTATFGIQEQNVTVTAGGSATADFTFHAAQ